MTNLKIFSTKVPSSMGLLIVCFLCHLTCPQCEVGQGSIGHSVEKCSVFNWKYSALSLSLPFFKDQFCKWKSPSSVLYFVLIFPSSQAHNGMNTKCTVLPFYSFLLLSSYPVIWYRCLESLYALFVVAGWVIHNPIFRACRLCISEMHGVFCCLSMFLRQSYAGELVECVGLWIWMQRSIAFALLWFFVRQSLDRHIQDYCFQFRICVLQGKIGWLLIEQPGWIVTIWKWVGLNRLIAQADNN